MSRIRNRLSAMLGERRWTQKDLARKTGIRPTTIGEIYHEIATQIKFTHLVRICDALECEISDLLYIDHNAPDDEDPDNKDSDK